MYPNMCTYNSNSDTTVKEDSNHLQDFNSKVARLPDDNEMTVNEDDILNC